MAKRVVKRAVPESEYRLRLLFALSEMGVCHQDDLWPFLAGLELMEYMPFCQLLSEMLESGEIGILPAGTLYVAEKGRVSLEMFASRLPTSLRENVKKKAPRYRKLLEEHKQVNAGYEPSDVPGLGKIYARYYEETRPVLLLKMSTRREGLCEKAVQGFSGKIPVLLPLLCSMKPIEGSGCAESTDALTLAEPGHPIIAPIGEGEYGAAVCLRSGDTEYRVQLLFNDFGSAVGWALGADKVGETLAEQLTRVLEA